MKGGEKVITWQSESSGLVTARKWTNEVGVGWRRVGAGQWRPVALVCPGLGEQAIALFKGHLANL